ncbi:ABC transporter permease [Streptococcus sp. S784/96/1]|uniref:ABC transporter permease n=2 Tax=Streptococcus sp. S784/96/1 TaxID=2653499 RepID=UPI001386EE32|nr:ABC transporter permease [Streptococcus sp. S784/96/1]
MSKYLKSELLKWKGSYSFYLIITISLLQLITIVPYILVISHNPIILENMIFLSMLGYCVFVAIISILVQEQEEQANHFQHIKSDKNRVAIWGMKIISADLLLALPSLIVWLIIGLELHKVPYYMFVGVVTWLLAIFLNHFHMFLILFIGKGGNLLLSFVECLFIIFATNKTFLDVIWMPIALPVNAILLYGNEKYIIALVCFIILSLIGQLIVISKSNIKRY